MLRIEYRKQNEGKAHCFLVIALENVAVQSKNKCNVFCDGRINKTKIYVNKAQRMEVIKF
jgi:hypothetical protein